METNCTFGNIVPRGIVHKSQREAAILFGMKDSLEFVKPFFPRVFLEVITLSLVVAARMWQPSASQPACCSPWRRFRLSLSTLLPGFAIDPSQPTGRLRLAGSLAGQSVDRPQQSSTESGRLQSCMNYARRHLCVRNILVFQLHSKTHRRMFGLNEFAGFC